MDYFFKRTKNIKDFLTGSSEEDNFESLSFEELLRKSSEFDFGNKKMEEKIKELERENRFLNNIIIRKNNNKKDSEYYNFLKLMENNLLYLKNDILSTNDYSTSTFKNFLYNEKIFLGTLEEDDINYLTKRDKDNKLNWKKDKGNYLIKQEILQNNLKALYSNMFITKYSRKIGEKKEKENKDNKKKNENKTIINEKQKNKMITKEKNYMNNYNNNNYIVNKNENISDFLDDLLD